MDASAWLSPAARIVFGAAMVCLLMQSAPAASAQATEAAWAWAPHTWLGVGASGYFLSYGHRKVGGISAFSDTELFRSIGVEGEARWLEAHQHNGAHQETYLAGGRYHWHAGRWEPYIKGLIGVGYFTFPFHGGTGSYFVAEPGAGVDFFLSNRWTVRADGDLQYWPGFYSDGGMKAAGITFAIRRRIF